MNNSHNSAAKVELHSADDPRRLRCLFEIVEAELGQFNVEYDIVRTNRGERELALTLLSNPRRATLIESAGQTESEIDCVGCHFGDFLHEMTKAFEGMIGYRNLNVASDAPDQLVSLN